MMVDTKHVLEQMRAANPVPSLEQLAGDDLDLVRELVAQERSAMTAPVREQPGRPDRPSLRRRMRPALVAGLAGLVVLGTLSVGLLLFGGGDIEPAEPVPTTVAPAQEPTATAGSACPPGSTPDRPGPPEQDRLVGGADAATFDPGSGRVLALEGEVFWTFDVCTNTWTAAPGPGDIDNLVDLVYDLDSGRAITFASHEDGVAQVWAYETDRQTWTKKNDRAIGPVPESEHPFLSGIRALLQAVYDPVSGLVLVRQPFTSAMWSYDVDTDTWTGVDQGTMLPPAFEQWADQAIDPDVNSEMFPVELLSYDGSVDRLILYVAPWFGSPIMSTWEFDIRAGRWEEHETYTPLNAGSAYGGWGPSGEVFTYDEANQVSVLFSGETLATYNASEHRWTVDSSDPGGDPLTYDPVNERILVTGGHGEPREEDGVYAFEVGTGEWITLLEPTPWYWGWEDRTWPVIGAVLVLALYLLLAAYGEPIREKLRRRTGTGYR